MKKFFIYLVCCLVGIVVLNIFFSYLIEDLIDNQFEPKLARTYRANEKLVILGASRASHHYDPQILSDSLGMSVYNYGIDGQNIYVHYAVLCMLMEHAVIKPHVVLYEINAIDVNDTPKWNLEKLSFLYPYYYKDDSIKQILDDLLDTSELLAIKTFGLYRHNSNYFTYIKNGMIISDDKLKGFIPLENEWKKDLTDGEEHGTSIDHTKVMYIEKFIKLCKENNIELIFVTSPSFAKVPTQKWVSEVKRISEEHQIPYLYYETNEGFLAHKEWFKEPVHLNKKGANVFSKLISHDLKSIIK